MFNPLMLLCLFSLSAQAGQHPDSVYRKIGNHVLQDFGIPENSSLYKEVGSSLAYSTKFQNQVDLWLYESNTRPTRFLEGLEKNPQRVYQAAHLQLQEQVIQIIGLTPEKIGDAIQLKAKLLNQEQFFNHEPINHARTEDQLIAEYQKFSNDYNEALIKKLSRPHSLKDLNAIQITLFEAQLNSNALSLYFKKNGAFQVFNDWFATGNKHMIQLSFSSMIQHSPELHYETVLGLYEKYDQLKALHLIDADYLAKLKKARPELYTGFTHKFHQSFSEETRSWLFRNEGIENFCNREFYQLLKNIVYN